MGLPKSLSQLYKRERHNSADHCPAWVFTPSLQLSKPSWAPKKKAEIGTAHTHNTACRWDLFKAPQQLEQCIPLSTELHFLWSISLMKGSVTIQDPAAFGHLQVQHHPLHHQVHPLYNDRGRLHKPGSDQGPAQYSSLLLYWHGVTSCPSPLVSGTSCSGESS